MKIGKARSQLNNCTFSSIKIQPGNISIFTIAIHIKEEIKTLVLTGNVDLPFRKINLADGIDIYFIRRRRFTVSGEPVEECTMPLFVTS